VLGQVRSETERIKARSDNPARVMIISLILS
jgi:hypothetical protein